MPAGQPDAPGGAEGRATIRDVARRAGVSAATVSRALAGDPRISQPTVERVRRAARDLRYVPDATARSLARGRTWTVALVLSRWPGPGEEAWWLPGLIQGFTAAAQAAGYVTLLAAGSGGLTGRHQLLQLLRERRVDGAAVVTGQGYDRLLEELAGRGLPLVAIGRLYPAAPVAWLAPDDVTAGRLATEHLVGLGHRRIALVAGPGELAATVDRSLGYWTALEQAGLETAGVSEGPVSAAEGYQAAARLVDAHPPPTAFVVAHDLMAVGVLQCLAERGLAVPRQAAVVCLEDGPLAPALRPPLTAVRAPWEELGGRSFRRLAGSLGAGGEDGGVSGGALSPPELVVRGSCGPPPDRGRA